MNLCIYTNAADKSRAAVVSATDTTVVDSLEQLVLGDKPAINVTFTSGSAAPSWAGQAGYALQLGLGLLDVNGLASQTYISSTTAISGGWSARLDLTTQAIIDALALQVGSAVDWTRFPFTSRMPGPRPNGGWLTLQVSVLDSSLNLTTYAELRVYVRNRVINPLSAATLAGIPLATFPTSGSATGSPGQVAYSAGYIAFCVATDTWIFWPVADYPF